MSNILKCWEFTCIVTLFTVRDEAVGWICLLAMAVPLFIKFMLRLATTIERENRVSAPAIDEEGYYI